MKVSKESKSKPKDSKNNGFIFGAQAQADKMRCEEQDKQSKDFKCELCDYICKKMSSLKKHINAKHTEQKCKICKMEFKSSM